MKDNTKQIIVVRKDLNMRKGKLAAQVAHASLQIFLNMIEWEHNFDNYLEGTIKIDNEYIKNWIQNKFTKIVVSCDSEEELLQLRDKCILENVLFSLIQDAGLTEFNNIPTYTCLAIGPDKNEKIDKITGHLKLL